MPSSKSGLVIEGGGSHTSLAYVTGDRRVFELHGHATNPRSISDLEATSILRDLLLQAKAQIPEAPFAVYAAHGAASTRHEANVLGNKIVDILGANILERVVVVNDLVPIALSKTGDTIVAAAGTGTGYLARSKQNEWRRASGYEFILSDEGGGFDLGQKTLRAVVKDIDGRGAPTLLTELVASRLKCARAEVRETLFEHIYRKDSNVKFEVAAFADIVFTADNESDGVARTLLDDAATELAVGIDALERSLGSPAHASLILTGSLLTAHHNLRQRLLEEHGCNRFHVSTFDQPSLLEITAVLMKLSDLDMLKLEDSLEIPVYIWKRRK